MLPISGKISFDMIRKELKRDDDSLSIGDEDARKIANKLSGTISISDFYGKSGEDTGNFNAVMIGGQGFYGGLAFYKSDSRTSLEPDSMNIKNQIVGIDTIHYSADETSNRLAIIFNTSDKSLFIDKYLEVTLDIDGETSVDNIHSSFVVSNKISFETLSSEVNISKYSEETLHNCKIKIVVKDDK